MSQDFRLSAASVLLAVLMFLGAIYPALAESRVFGTPPVKAHGPKNIIIMISDGCGPNQILATDYYTYGQAGAQSYEQFPVQLHMSTYSLGQPGTEDDRNGIYDPASMWSDFGWINKNATDSAASATAMATGIKTYDAAIGVDSSGNALKSITEEFEEHGKATGVVSSVPFSHATPASFVAHNKNRKSFRRIAVEMIRDSTVDVIMGGGNPLFDKSGDTVTDPSDLDYRYVGGEVIWKALTGDGIGADADRDGIGDPWTLIQTKEDFESLQTGDTPKRVIGIPQVFETLQQGRSGSTTAAAFQVPYISTVPTLEIMARGALNVLDSDPDGFFLMVEGGAIDWANHSNQSGRMIEEETDFNNTVTAVCSWVEENSSWDETLLIVTGDHESGCLTGTSGVFDAVVNNGKGNMPGMTWNSVFHTNQLIPLFAKGADAQELVRYADQTDPILGPYLDNTEIAVSIRSMIE